MEYDMTLLRAEHRDVFREARDNPLVPVEVVDQLFSVYAYLKTARKNTWNTPEVKKALVDATESVKLERERAAERKAVRKERHPTNAEVDAATRKAARVAARLDERSKAIEEG